MLSAPDFSHLDALLSRLNRERVRLAKAYSTYNTKEAMFRERAIAACQREIDREREFLGLAAEAEISDDDLLAELEGCF